MSAPWGDNSRPDNGCGFCSDFQRMKDDPEVCWGCPHDPSEEASALGYSEFECPVCGAPGRGCTTCLAELRCDVA